MSQTMMQLRKFLLSLGLAGFAFGGAISAVQSAYCRVPAA